MNLGQLSRIAPHRLYQLLFSENGLCQFDTVTAHSKTYIETKGDIGDIQKLILDNYIFEDSDNFGDSPIEIMLHLHTYMMASSTIFGHKDIDAHLRQSDYSDYLTQYPNLYKTFQVWAWG